MKTAALIALTVFFGLATAAPPYHPADKKGTNSRPIQARSCKKGNAGCSGPQMPALAGLKPIMPVPAPAKPATLTQRGIVGGSDLSASGLGNALTDTLSVGSSRKSKKPTNKKRDESPVRGAPSAIPAIPATKSGSALSLLKAGGSPSAAPKTKTPLKKSPSRRDLVEDTLQDEHLQHRQIQARGPKALQETDTVEGPKKTTAKNNDPSVDQLVDAAGDVLDGLIDKRDEMKKKVRTVAPKWTVGLLSTGLSGAARAALPPVNKV